MLVTITQKDIEKNNIQYTDSGYIIDELAYSVGEWTSNDLYENNIDYEPREPYNYNYENDLFEHTKTYAQYSELCTRLDIATVINSNWTPEAHNNLQCGAWIALNYPVKWSDILSLWIDALKSQSYNDDQEVYSKQFADDLEKEKESFHEDMYKEWLNGDRDYDGVVYRISKYYTEGDQGEYDEKNHCYIFDLDENDIEHYKDRGYRKNQMKKALLDAIKSAGEKRKNKEILEREARAVERKRLKEYREMMEKKEKEAREKKLLQMTIK